MGPRDWFRTVINVKKSLKESHSKEQNSTPSNHSKGFKWRYHKHKGSEKFLNGTSNLNPEVANVHNEDRAAIIIQTAFRGFLAHKAYYRLKGIQRLQFFKQRLSIQNQTSSTLGYLQLLSRIHAQVQARRHSVLAETRNKQKKHEHQLKLEAKLQEIEVEWCSGSESMEEILARIHEREAATAKRERALAYAFSHQWRASNRNSPGKGGYDLGKDNWGWSWTDSCLMACQLENRISTPVGFVASKRVQNTPASKKSSAPPSKISVLEVSSNRPDSVVVKKLFSTENSPNREASETGQDVEATIRG